MTASSPRILVTLWKPYRSLEEVENIIAQAIADTTIAPQNRYIALPYTYLKTLSAKLAASGVVFGSDFLDPVAETSFTGTIATRLLKEAGARFVLVGTAERRRKFGETNAQIRDKLQNAARDDLIPFLCVGENCEDFSAGRSKEVLIQQLKECLEGLSAKQLKGLTIVYEAPWMDTFPYRPNENELTKAYEQFNAALKEALDEKVLNTLHLIYAYPYDLDHLPVFFQSHDCDGYFFEKPIHYSDLTRYELHEELKPSLKDPHESIAAPGILEKQGIAPVIEPKIETPYPETHLVEESKVVVSEEQLNAALDESISPVGEQVVKKEQTKIAKEEL
jgi:triosephosphate isomerase